MTDGEVDFRLLFEQSPDVLLVLAPDPPKYTMIGATDARLAATHTTREQMVGKGLFELFPDNPDDPAASGARNLRDSLDRVIATKAPDTMAVQKYDIRGPDGGFETKHWSPRNIPVLTPKGEVRYILHRVEDVTDLVRASEAGEELRGRNRQMEREVVLRSRELAAANADLRLVNAKLGELDLAKTAFFSNVSHEFRTPLTLMLGPLEDALASAEDPLSAPQRARLQLALDNTLRLFKLVNTLLDFSRLEAGRMRAHFAPVDLGQVTADLAQMFQSAFDAAELALVLDCPPSTEPAWVDRDMWEKIVPNLVSNAFKFTLEGSVTVRTREEGDRFIVEVIDTGVGIAAAELHRVFERFHRVEGARGRTHEGTGIGLALVRELVALHGGTIEVESEVGRGTTFRVRIPKGFAHLPQDSVSREVAAATAAREAAVHASEAERWISARPSPPTAAGKMDLEAKQEGGEDERSDAEGPPSAKSAARPRVLVVDDNADLRAYIAGILSPHYEVTTAVDGLDGLELAQHAPDLIVSDVMMPGLDGFGLVKELRARKATASLPVILLSARAGEEAAIEGLDAGADDYLMKPFSARELLARVRTHVELATARRLWIAELERTNRELDAFSYSVSHDLRAPLRAIDGFSAALEEDYASALDAQAKGYLARIRNAVARMALLIDDLLGLSRITRAKLKAEPVDLSALAAEVVAELRRAQPEREVDVEVQEGLTALGDRRLLQIALTNLISNAWKFSARNAEARITIAKAEGEEPTFVIRDNGAGFNPEYADRLFKPFQRLHAVDDFEGTGIGLAIVQRVIARHHGRLWATSELGKGAAFFFSVPSKRPLPVPGAVER